MADKYSLTMLVKELPEAEQTEIKLLCDTERECDEQQLSKLEALDETGGSLLDAYVARERHRR